MKTPQQDKHISYFNLLDSFKTDECPICNLIKKNVNNYFDSLLYENINNFSFIETFNKDMGFCDYHAYKFLSYNDGQAIVLTYKDILKKRIKELEKNEKKHFIKNYNEHCIICRLIKNSEKRYLTIFSSFIEEEEFQEEFLKSKGLCIPHFQKLIEINKKIPSRIMKFQLKKYKKIYNIAKKFINSCNVSLGKNRPTLTREEETVWKQMVQLIYGDPEIIHY